MNAFAKRFQFFNKYAAEIFIILIRAYQSMISPLKGVFLGQPHMQCRFFPTCSTYACDALRQYGLLYGVMASVRRITKCNPWNAGGYDPVKGIKRMPAAFAQNPKIAAEMVLCMKSKR